jgi:hypothetical protein
VSRYVVVDFVEQGRYRVERDLILRSGPPYTEILFDERVKRIREDLARHGGMPPSAVPFADMDGSYLYECDGLIVRYFVTKAIRPSFWKRMMGAAGSGVDEIPVRIRFQAVDWPNVELWRAR